jgi:hypothetical protein
MTITNGASQPKMTDSIVSINGGGGGWCSDCSSVLAFCNRVTLASGERLSLCSECLTVRVLANAASQPKMTYSAGDFCMVGYLTADGANEMNALMAADNESTFWACVDCVLARENDEGDITSNAWSLLPDASVSFDYNSEEQEEETRIEFSTADCEACGSALAGTRYRYTLYTN